MSNALYKINFQVQKAEQKSHGLLLVLLDALLLLAELHIYASDNEFVACVERKKSYGTPLIHIIQENV